MFQAFMRFPALERITGIEPVTSAWEAEVLPLNYIRKNKFIITQRQWKVKIFIKTCFTFSNLNKIRPVIFMIRFR